MPSVLYRAIAVCLILLSALSPAWAEDDWGDESDDDAFAEAADITQTQAVRPWSFGGFARTRVGFWVERMRGPSVHRAELG